MIPQWPPWNAVETELATRPKIAVVRLAVRAAARLVPLIVEGSEHYGPEAVEWAHATDAAVKAVEAFARGEPVSRFTLDLAAELARGTANAASAIVRMLGHSKSAEDAELAFAAAAFAADTARLSASGRIASAGMQALRVVDSSGRVPVELSIADYSVSVIDTPLWPDGEPEWYREGRAILSSAVGLPILLKRSQ